MRRQTPHQPPRAHIPQEDRLVVAPAGKDIPLWRKRKAVNIVMMSQQRAPPSPASSNPLLLPTAHPIPPRPPPPRRRPRHRHHLHSSPSILHNPITIIITTTPLRSNRMRRTPRHAIPQPDSFVVGPRGERPAVGRPREARHARHMADQRVEVRTRRRVPQLGGAVGRGGRDPAPVGGHADLGDGGGVALEKEGGGVVREEGLERAMVVVMVVMVGFGSGRGGGGWEAGGGGAASASAPASRSASAAAAAARAGYGAGVGGASGARTEAG